MISHWRSLLGCYPYCQYALVSIATVRRLHVSRMPVLPSSACVASWKVGGRVITNRAFCIPFRFSHTAPGGDLNQKPNNIELSRSLSLQEKRSNGHVLMNGHVSSNPNGSDVVDRGRSGTGVSRTNSLDRSTSSPAKVDVGVVVLIQTLLSSRFSLKILFWLYLHPFIICSLLLLFIRVCIFTRSLFRSCSLSFILLKFD